MRHIAKILTMLVVALAASWATVSWGALRNLPRDAFKSNSEDGLDIPPLSFLGHSEFCLSYPEDCALQPPRLHGRLAALAPDRDRNVDTANGGADRGAAPDIGASDASTKHMNAGFVDTTQAPVPYTWFSLGDLDALIPHGTGSGERPIAMSPQPSNLKPVDHRVDRQAELEVERMTNELTLSKPELAKISFGPATLPPIGHTRFCLKYPDDCTAQRSEADGTAEALTLERWRELNAVNRQVNRDIIPQITGGNGLTEEWVIAPTAGDCKDYAITKRHELLARGWPSQALLLAEVIVPDGEHHLILVVRTKDVDLVLDNLNANIRPAAMTYRQYKWVRIELPRDPKFWASIRQPEPVRTAQAFD